MAEAKARGRPGRWRNWSGSVTCSPREIMAPTSLDELARAVGAIGRAGRRLRVVGSGHSFTPLVQTDDALLRMDQLSGIADFDAERGLVTVLG
ncbi:MAG: FAD-binding protein, partial [Ktedonobacterales bacterium]